MNRMLIALILVPALLSQAPPAATSTPGKALGETIKGVVETLFPSIAPIIELFRKKENKPENEKKKQDEIAAKVVELKTKTKRQLAPIAQLAEELALIDQIAGNAAIAEVSLARINVMLSLPDLAPATWDAVKEEWSNAAKALTKIEAIKTAEILDKVKDDAIQARLLDARQIQEESSNRVVQRLPGKNAPHIREQTMKLQDALLAARNLSTIKLARMSRELKTVQEYVNSPQGVTAAVEAVPSDYLKVTDLALARAKQIKDQ